MKVLIAYLSYSGNTEETAQMIAERCREAKMEVEMHQIGVDPPINPEEYALICLGTFTWDRGSTPEEMKEFVLEIGYKPGHIAVFGSGDTQFGGDELFCRAVDKLWTFYGSKWPMLKIEQSPRGSQERKVIEWTEGVLYDVRNTTGNSKNVGTTPSE
ncbi:flavodoxin [Virgibacillus xinjiangensis]|uniref:Flavodoxin n=1 Tax=Virgibacillus xinjiangensis TaxID=393090 RepID=A0ABV7CXR9_9BACI